MSILIRPARPADAVGIARVHVESWRNTYPGMVPDGYLVGLSATASAARWLRVLAGRGTFVAIDDREGIVGFATCGAQRTRLEGFGGEFYAIYLLDYMQGQGIGRRLMATMASELMDAGMTSAVVWVLEHNPSRWFYERLGGARLAEQPIAFAGAVLTEVAYGWRDLAPLARLSAGPRVR